MGNGPSYSGVAVVQWYSEGRKLYGKEGYKVAKENFCDSDIQDMSEKIVMITGANSGIGYSAAEEFAKLNAEVHLVCRNSGRGEIARSKIAEITGNHKIYCHICDTSVMNSVRSFSEDFLKHHSRLDVLVNNAGGMPSERTITSEGNEQIMATMLGGTMLLTSRLLSALKKSEDARVINVSSGGAYTVKGITQDLNNENIKKYDGTFFYALAKRNQIILTEEWSERLKNQGVDVAVNCMHPGWAATTGVETAMKDFFESNREMLRSPLEGADTIVFLGSAPRSKLLGSGHFWFDRQPVRTHMPFAWTTLSKEERKELWNKSAKYVGGVQL